MKYSKLLNILFLIFHIEINIDLKRLKSINITYLISIFSGYLYNLMLHIWNIFQEMKKHIDDFLGGYDENRFMVMPGFRGIGKSTLIF